jgi:hypothetical protein
MSHAKHAYGFVAPGTKAYPSATLWLAAPERGDWYVSNIVPSEGRLTLDQYNTILREFFDEFVANAAAAAGVSATLEKTDKGPEDFFSAGASKLLERFSIAANMSTGSGHPADQQRWLAFIIQVYRDNRGPEASTLSDLLHQHFGWPEETASILAAEYAFGLALLRQADAN